MKALWNQKGLRRFGALLLAGGCIADTAEDSDLPWATNQGWEGMIPIPAGAANQYD